jgi:hypothetical protein
MSAAGWLGAMGYSLFVVQPRAAAFFAGRTDADEDLEQFVSTLAHRQRWPVLTALATLAISGALLVVLGRPRPTSMAWTIAVSVQSLCLVVAAGLFSFVPWRMWPARVFALPAARPALRRRFRQVGLTLFTLAVVATAVAAFSR